MSAPRAAEAGCPKWMTHGPCGGVQPDGSCEIGGPCAFVDGAGGSAGPGAPGAASGFGDAGGAGASTPLGAAPAHAAPLGAAGRELLELMDRRPIVVADLPSPGPDADSERRLADQLAGMVDVALLGDAPWARVQLPPSLRASIVAEQGLVPWAGLNCRDRNRVALEAELAGLAGVEGAAVHCVTGDHPALGHRADAQPVFDLDSTQLTALAAQTGLLVSVAETPGAPPALQRPARAASKAVAGARVCFVNLAGELETIEAFVAATRVLAPQLRFIACVPMVISAEGAARLAAFFPGAVLPDAVLASLREPNPAKAAIRAAITACTAVLELDGIDGVDLSAVAGPGPGEAKAVAQALARVGTELGAGE